MLLSTLTLKDALKLCYRRWLLLLKGAFEKLRIRRTFFHFLPAVFRAKPQLTERLEEASIVRPARALTLFLLGKGRREILGTR